MRILKFSIFVLFTLSLYNCSTMQLAPADFSWPIETVLDVNKDGAIEVERYSFSVNVRSMFLSEAGEDTTNMEYKPVRMIRNKEGYYFVTSENFKNVYVFSVSEGVMKLANKIQIKETGMNSPVFNQRSPNIELVDGANMPIYLNKDGIVGGEK